ncbi:FadR family transcriptional regulator [Peribacillus cavernae]|uniref:FadR family transcriptional regulator n=1 Tax=Peribacillus cavernae TaxID=1674310 RepID=A0A3S0VUI2_9BACI|nr:FadR/GntR family transcriptional regulator [Peribacillus cavernae]MDQ0221265.1 DNA-binding FadR family transcriptional regulator [Peribacillus cavernae]RUQ25108.1 FadR family transcriptional regulator [Peribacillus cavernae]
MSHQKKAFLEIAQKIKKDILIGNLPIGAKLPSERALAESFQTSRATVREALRALEIIGIIESHVGQGTFVKTTNISEVDHFQEIANQTSPSEVFEARIAIEPYLAELATFNATPKDFQLLESCLQKTNEAIGNSKEFEKLDAEFHFHIANSAKNSLLLSFIDTINKVRLEKLWGTLKVRSLNEERMNHYYQQHVAIFEAIKERDINKVKHFSIDHLKTVRKNMLEE